MKQITEDIRQGTFSPVYVLYGEEAYLRLRYLARLSDAIVPPEDSMNRTRFAGTGHTDAEVIEQAETLPFFSERRLVILKDGGFLSSSHPDLAAYLANIPDYLHIVICEETADKRNAVFKAASAAGHAAEFPRQEENVLIRWAAKRLQDAGLKIRQKDMEYFCHLVGGDMYALAGELDKLISYMAPGEGRDVVERADIDAVTTVQLENRIFDMIRAVCAGKTAEAVRLYRDLVALKEPPLRILSLLTRQYNQMLLAERLRREGLDAAAIASEIGAPPFAVRGYLRQLAAFPDGALLACVRRCVETEEDIKSGRIEDRLGVEMLILGEKD